MKKIFTLLFAVCLVAFAYAQQTATTPVTTITPTTNAPPITLPDNLLFLKETEFDFGKIPGKPVTHVFGSN